jgi:dTDP-L-rhamnose 4-epimerase
LLALESDAANFGTFNIGTGRAISIREITRMLSTHLGKNIKPEIVGKYREGDIRHCVADISRARERLGYQPRVSLEQGIPELIEWVKQQQAETDSKKATAELEQRQLVR